ncbi:MAG TPA: SpoIIE family protein phosphatase [Euzebyales bacterium]|nr:SpoIIE family protein phosphatase [Euzebyales bacterium]
MLAWLQALIANAPQGMALLDTDLRYVLVNNALSQINGMEVEEHLGRSIQDVFPDYADLIVPLMRNVVETGSPVRGLPIRGETPAQPGVERSWEIDVYPVDAPDGRRLGVALGVAETTREQRQRQRLIQLQHLSAALAGAATVDRLAAIVSDHAMPHVGADETTLVVLSADRLRLYRYAADGIVESFLDADDSPAGAAVRSEQQQFVGDDGSGGHWVAYPLITPSGTIGALEWYWRRPPGIDEERAVLATASDLCAAALERARLADIRQQLATGFQRSLLPASLPRVQGLELAVRYRASVREAHTGGDWYDALTRPDGSVMLVVGDVVGHSTLSAAIMSELRHSLRTMLFVLGDPAAALTQVDAMLTHLTTEPTVMATVAALCFDPDLTRCTYALAGHPAPLLIDRHGQVALVGGTPGALLGAHLEMPFGNVEAALDPGTVLALFTDGVIERRGEDLDHGIARLAAALATIAADRPLEQAIEDVMRKVEEEATSDDAALLLARLAPQPW